MPTALGRELHKIRIDHNQLLRDMAVALGYSVSYLSAIEGGRRSIPAHFVDKVIGIYKLDDQQARVLRKAEDESTEQIKMNFLNMNSEQRDVGILLAKNIGCLNPRQLDAIKKVLNACGETTELLTASSN